MNDIIFSYFLKITFLTFLVLSHVTEIYLHIRQILCLKKSYNQVPEDFSSQLSLSEHQKSINYSSTKLNFSIAQLFWSFLFLIMWFPGNGVNFLFSQIPFNGLQKDVLLLLSFILINILFSLPWSLYHNFVIEEKFGFNKMTYKIFFIDKLKTFALILLFLTPLLYSLLALANFTGDLWWLYAFLGFTLFQFLLLWIFPTFISPLFNKFNPLEDKDLKEKIMDLMGRNQFDLKDVFVMDASKRSSHGNAYFTGLGKNKRVVFFDTLLKDLSHEEIISILAHELGHMKLKHILKSLIISTFLSFIGFTLMGFLANKTWFFYGHFLSEKSFGILLLIFMQVIPIYTFFTTPISSWFSRKNEFEADRFAAENASASALISGLLTLYRKNSSPVLTDRLFSLFYFSHPPAKERIDHLNSLGSKTSQRLS